jgi:hypothetical protein
MANFLKHNGWSIANPTYEVLAKQSADADVLLSAAVATGASRAVGLELDTEFPS